MATKEIAVVDADFEVERSGTALATRQVGIVARGTPGAGGLIRPVAAPSEVLAVQNETRALVHQALKEGRDYGKIPGTNKNTLYKPGAERTNAAFAVYPEFEIVEKEIDHDREVHWTKKGRSGSYSGVSQGLYRYVLKCYLIHRESGAIIGTGVGSCSTLESKYIDRPRDLENTVFKMAKKRAYVDATLTAYGLSDEFTQDVEDMDPDAVQGGASGGEEGPECPECGGAMWDNREGKTNPKAPDFKCKDRKCKGVLWPGQWPPKEEDEGEESEESEEQRLTRQIEGMLEEIRKIDPKKADAAFEFAAKTIGDGKTPTAKELRACGSKVLGMLQRLQALQKGPQEAASAERNPRTSGSTAPSSASATAASAPSSGESPIEEEMDGLFDDNPFPEE